MTKNERAPAAGDGSPPDAAEASAPQDGASGGAAGGAAASTVTYSASPDLAGWLARTRTTIALTSYQSGKFYLIGANPRGGLMVHERLYEKAMGLCAPSAALVSRARGKDEGEGDVREGDTLLLATLNQIVRFSDVLEADQRVNDLYDACFVPRASWTTGAVDLHDVGMGEDGRPIFVVTAYNCLATVSERHSFRPVWRPPFVSAIVREDRCHLNGLAMGERGTADEGVPRFVTACSRSDTIDGWRDRRADGGVVIDVRTNEVVCSGLSMPHSPRLHGGELFVLNSGTGELGRVRLGAAPEEAFEPIAFCPGFARGLGFAPGGGAGGGVGGPDLAIVGLSKPRYQRFEGLALDERLRAADSEPWCGVQAIDPRSGQVMHWFRIDGAIAELYDVTTVPDTLCAMALGHAGPEINTLITHEPMAGAPA